MLNLGIEKIMTLSRSLERINGSIARLRTHAARYFIIDADSLPLLPESSPRFRAAAQLLAKKMMDDLQVPAECRALLKRAVLEDPAAMVQRRRRDRRRLHTGSSTSCARCRTDPGHSRMSSSGASMRPHLASPTCASPTTTCPTGSTFRDTNAKRLPRGPAELPRRQTTQ